MPTVAKRENALKAQPSIEHLGIQYALQMALYCQLGKPATSTEP